MMLMLTLINSNHNLSALGRHFTELNLLIICHNLVQIIFTVSLVESLCGAGPGCWSHSSWDLGPRLGTLKMAATTLTWDTVYQTPCIMPWDETISLSALKAPALSCFFEVAPADHSIISILARISWSRLVLSKHMSSHHFLLGLGARLREQTSCRCFEDYDRIFLIPTLRTTIITSLILGQGSRDQLVSNNFLAHLTLFCCLRTNIFCWRNRKEFVYWMIFWLITSILCQSDCCPMIREKWCSALWLVDADVTWLNTELWLVSCSEQVLVLLQLHSLPWRLFTLIIILSITALLAQVSIQCLMSSLGCGHLSSVTFPPLCPSVLKPNLRRNEVCWDRVRK